MVRPEKIDDPDELSGTTTWVELLAETKARLTGIEGDSTREAQWIFEEILGVQGADYREQLDHLATTRGVAALDRMVAARLAGTPIQYVLGHWQFRQLDLLVDERVLIPRPETELLTGLALAELDALGGGHVLDLGTGSGAIGLSVAHERDSTEVWLTELSEQAVAVARANLAALGRAASRVRLLHGSWFAPLDDALRGSFDVIVSNPPYIPTSDELAPSVVDFEPSTALFAGEDGLEDLRVITREGPEWLAPRGAMLVELDPRQVDDVVAMLECEGAAQTTVEKDLAGFDRFVVARFER